MERARRCRSKAEVQAFFAELSDAQAITVTHRSILLAEAMSNAHMGIREGSRIAGVSSTAGGNAWHLRNDAPDIYQGILDGAYSNHEAILLYRRRQRQARQEQMERADGKRPPDRILDRFERARGRLEGELRRHLVSSPALDRAWDEFTSAQFRLVESRSRLLQRLQHEEE